MSNRNLKRFVMDKLGATYRPPAAPVTRKESIGIVGAGYAVHVYEMTDRLGGMMIWGIPAFRLPPDRNEEEPASAVVNILKANAGEASMMARCAARRACTTSSPRTCARQPGRLPPPPAFRSRGRGRRRPHIAPPRGCLQSLVGSRLQRLHPFERISQLLKRIATILDLRTRDPLPGRLKQPVGFPVPRREYRPTECLRQRRRQQSAPVLPVSTQKPRISPEQQVHVPSTAVGPGPARWSTRSGSG